MIAGLHDGIDLFLRVGHRCSAVFPNPRVQVVQDGRKGSKVQARLYTAGDE